MIGRRHQHQWQQVGTDYVPPRPGVELTGRGEAAYALVRDLTYGYTTISLRCAECGDVAIRRVHGRYRDDRPTSAPSATQGRTSQPGGDVS